MTYCTKNDHLKEMQQILPVPFMLPFDRWIAGLSKINLPTSTSGIHHSPLLFNIPSSYLVRS